MTFIPFITPDESQGETKRLYDQDLSKKGYISNYTLLFGRRPEVLDAWRALQASIRRNMRLRRYELVTFAAATALHCSY